MPGPTTSILFPPASWDEFEEIARDLFARRWSDSYAQRHGRTGQPQHGVDIYGQPRDLGGRYVGVQCKRYEDGSLTQQLMEREIAKAECFTPSLAEYTIATTERRDVKLQAAIRAINEERRPAGKFPVHIVFWEDLCAELADPANHDLLRKHYAAWLQVLAGALASAHLDAVQVLAAEILEEAGRDFVGRQWAFETVAAFIGQHDRGYLRITADAGLGKTALAAQLAVRYGSLPFFFDASTGLTSAALCRRALAAQLIARFRLPHAGAPAETGETGAFLATLLREAADQRRPDTPLVLVIDGLDEADAPPPGQNWLLLPDRLPPGVYVLLTGRPGDYPLATAPGTLVQDLAIRADDPRQRGDIAAYLREQAQREAIARVREAASPPLAIEDFAGRLAAASEGNFMYLRYVLDDLASQEIAAADFAPDTLPRGLAGYYERFWSHLARDREGAGWERWDRLQRPTLTLLAVAGEPVDLTWLALHTRQRTEELRERVLLPWRRFLRVDGALGAERWRVIHRSFADFLATRRELDLPTAHRSVAAYYQADPARWREHDGYARRHLSRHLHLGGARDDLFALVDGPAWAEAQRQADPSGAAFLADLAEAWGVAEESDTTAVAAGAAPPLLGRELWCALATASLHSLAEALPAPLLVALVGAGRWTVDHALAAARRHPDSGDRAVVLATLVPACPPERQQAVRREALAMAREHITPRGRAETLTAVGVRLPPSLRREALAEAGQAALLIEDAGQRAIALAAVAAALPLDERGPIVERAIKALWAITYDDAWRAALLRLVPLLSDAQRDQLLAAARVLDDPRWRADALAALAPTLPSTERPPALRAALDDALRIGYVHSRARPIATLAPHLSPDELREALAAMPFDPDAHWALWPALAALLCRQATFEDLDGVLATAQALRDPRLREHVLQELAMQLAELGQAERALVAARAIPDGTMQGRTLARLIPRLPPEERAGVVREVLDLARADEIPIGRTIILEALAPHLPAELLDEAAALLGAVDDTVHWVRSLLELLPRLSSGARASALREALAAVRGIPHERSRALALAALGPALPDDLHEEALAACTTIRDADLRAEALAGLVPAVPEATRLVSERLRVFLGEVAALADEDERAQAMQRSVALQQVPVALLDEALASAAELLSGRAYDGVLAAATWRRAEAGDVASALATARRIGDAPTRARTLAGLVPRLPELERQSVLAEVLVALRPEEDEDDWVRAMADLVLVLSANQAQQAIRTCRRLSDQSLRARLLIRLIPRVPLARRRPLLREALREIRCGERWRQGELLASLAPALPRALQSAALRLAASLGDEYQYLRVLGALAPRLRGPLVAPALEWVRDLPVGQPGRAEALAALAIRLPAAEQEPAVREALDAVGPNERTGWSSDALQTLAQHLSDDQLQEALARAVTVPDEHVRSRLLGALTPRLVDLTEARGYTAWRTLLRGLAQHSRQDFLWDPTPMWSLLVHIGGPGISDDAVMAMLAVVRRWP